jgi:DNA-binding CsgD family transcriptional regulator
MTAITDRDLHQMVAIAHGYTGQADPGDPLPWPLLHDLKELVPCDQLSVNGQDTPRWEFFAGQELPAAPLPPGEAAACAAAYREHYWDSTCSHPDRTGDITTVVRDSDLQSQRELRASAMRVDYLSRYGVEHELMVCLDAGGPQRTLRLLFARGAGPDFSLRDVEVLTLLRPHLQAVYAAAAQRRRGAVPLTARQREILQYVGQGWSNHQIARHLFVAEGTVRKHLENAFARLGVNSRTAAVAQLSPLAPAPSLRLARQAG